MSLPSNKNLSDLIKKKARDLGFDLCGIAPSGILRTHETVIRDWCASGMNGEMNYLCQNIDKRVNPSLLFPGAKSVIVTGLNYFTEKKQGGDGIPIISRYAYGDDYHDVIRKRLNDMLKYIKEISAGAEGKSFVDTAPVLEKAWAREAGLGWTGRNSILINNSIGSFFFLGIILLNIEVDYDIPFLDDKCGTCRACIESCPTGAINENRTIDARRCISYLTVESKMAVPLDLAGKFDGRIFGCDKCQEICPWNNLAEQHNNREFFIPEEMEEMKREDWKQLTPERFKRLFKNSSIARRTFSLFMDNIRIVTSQGNY